MTKNNDFLYKKQGKRLFQLRKKLDLKVATVSAECGISTAAVYQYESGEIFPGSKYLCYLYDRRNVNLNFIFGKEKRMFRPDPKNIPPDFGNLQEQVDEMLRMMDANPRLCFRILSLIEGLKEES